MQKNGQLPDRALGNRPMTNGEKVNILIVDDQPSRLLSYEVILGELNQNIVRAGSGAEALQELMRREYAVILLDVNMPGMDGFETAQMIHQHPRYENTPLVFVTAFNVTDMDRLKGYELGAVDYVYIPVIPAILRSKVSVLVELFLQKQELRRLNQNLAQANAELAVTNSTLEAEKGRDLERMNRDLEFANAELERTNQILTEEIAVRRRAEEAQQRSDQHLHAILQNTSALINLIDLEGRFVHLNRSWEVLLPCSSQDARGKSIYELLPEPVARAFDEHTKRVLTERRPQEFEWNVLLADGRSAVFNSIKAPLLDAAGEPYGIVGVSTDITERKMLENALRDADRRKDEFIAMLAHELRNPLAPIVNGLEMMRLKNLNDPQLVWCRDVITRQVAHLSRLVEDLLDVSRITQGKIKLQTAEVELTKVIERAIETVRPLIDSHHHALTVHMPEDPVVIHGDAMRLAQILSNLLSNAAKYTQDSGKIQLHVSCTDSDVQIRVKDSGVGIPAEMMPKMFELFVQFERTLDRSQGGLGIGLALVKRLVELHGGDVSVHSEGSGRGSEFVVHLPLIPARSVSVPKPSEEDSPMNSPVPGRKILVVDDNVDAADALTMLLRHTGHRVQTAHSGLEAVSQAQRFQPQVIFLDLGMPGMNGYEAAQLIRKLPRGGEIMLVALTGWSQSDAREATRRAGFDLHLVKPVDHLALQKLLDALPSDPNIPVAL
ncbi:MAG TPA: response regulator [Planctomycetota bacterium]|nr:response regulator [Planctomycetota bacterium]